jgi:iron(III) transport system ATP-binding protein
MESAAVLKNVRKSFGARSVLTDFSLDVPRGGSTGILGASGSGKTTILRLIAGLEIPDSGEVQVAGRIASSAGRLLIPPSQRNVGYVFQDLALWPHMTVAGNLRFVLESRKWPPAKRDGRITEMLAVVGLGDRAAEYPTHLSGGEQQRVALARALVAQPDLLLLDEPLSSLDEDLRAELRVELASLPARFGITMVYVTHDRNDALALGGKVIELVLSGKYNIAP